MKDILKDIGAMFVLLASTAIRIVGAFFQVVAWTTGKVYELLNSLGTRMLDKSKRRENPIIDRGV